MGYVLPEWIDTVLDFVGINWPNVDEDDYREMADAMRELADAFDDHAGEAHGAVSRLLSSSEGWAVDSMQEHWGKVKSSHLEQLPEVARMFADAMDVVADLIYGMKIKAELELAAMAASAGVAISLIVATGGLSALLGAAQITAMREAVRRIIKEAAEQIVEQVIAMVTEPVAAKLEDMVADAVLELATEAFSPGTGDGSDGKGASGMNLNSANGPGGGGPGGGGNAGRMRIDHVEYEKAAGDLGRISETSLTRLNGSLGRADGANSRTKGKDPFTQGIDSLVDGGMKGMRKTVVAVIRHNGELVPKNMRDTSKRHKENEKANEDALRKIMGGRDGKDPTPPSKGPGGNGGTVGTKPDLLNKALNDPRHHSVEPPNRTCKEDPIDVASGQMLLEQTDLSLPGVLPLVLKRTHLSDYTYGTWFGRSWASTLDERIEVDVRNKAVWAREDGTLLVYDRLPSPQQPEILPVEGPRIPLRRTSDFGAHAMEFATTDPRTGWTKYFSRPRGEGWQLWLTTIEDRNGNQIDIHRDGTGRPLAVGHSGGYDVEVAGDLDRGRVTALALRTGDGAEAAVPVLAFGYDGQGDLAEVTNSSGSPLRFTYDEQSRITSWTDRNDSTYRYMYDTAGRVVQTVGPDGFQSGTFAYDVQGRTTRWTDALGAVTEFRLNERRQIIAELNPLGHVAHAEFDARDHLIARTDPLGRTTRYTYDVWGNPLTLTRPDSTQLRVCYNELNLPVEVVHSDGTRVVQEFDSVGNCTAVTDATGATTRYAYDGAGNLTSVTNALDETTHVRCDAAGLPIEITDPLGASTRYERDSAGRAIVVTDPLGAATRLQWTVEGRLAARTAPDGATESWTYDGEGNCTSHTDAVGGVSRFEYTHFDRLAASTGPDGARYEFEYDRELRLARVTNPLGFNWSYEYDPAGRLVAEIDFDQRRVTYEHDAAGQLAARFAPTGEAIRFERDVLNRTVRKDAAGAVTSYAYDAAGRLISATGPDASLVREHDAAGRMCSETVDGRTVTYTYDALGRRTSRTTPTGATSTSTYDGAGNRTSLTASGRVLDFVHDAAGREVARHIGEASTLASTFDPAGRLAQQQLTGPAGHVQHRGYTYRADGSLIGIDDQSGSARRFDLDPASRVTAVHAADWTESYAYDEAGNQTQATWPTSMPGAEAAGDRTYNGTRILAAGHVRYEHDEAGRITVRRKTTLSGKHTTWRYTWDAEDRLTSVATPDGTTWRYAYDPLGRRTAKQRLAPDRETVAEETLFTWDGATLAEQTMGTVTLTWDHDGLRPLTQTERKHLTDQEVDERFFAIITDLIGTPTELVDEHGDIAWRTRTTLWGTTVWNRTASAYTPLRFPGQYFDPETGLHYNYFRHYDPETARYLTPDPLGLAPAPNPSAYVDNPLSWADPLGLSPCKDALLDAVGKEADAASKVTPGRMRPAVSEGIALQDGSTFTASSHRGNAPTLHPDVQGVLDGIPADERGRGHGQCGLPNAISQALNEGRDPNGALGAAVTVRSNVDHPKHAMPVGPCDSCKVLVRHYGIDFITGD
ncbi:RHS repeat-associated core domain-containing protein [Streptomyces sp. B-S-A8]|uniref:RHS repeat-associated core domain-containing protein n=1 Tax=Streptomyces solicavernae TaxID=3043614 RepID=A0ABT6RP60_9ACTN|nr:DUF6531 domain-containing protein [Streptomyces sp. B-S-A8]MDI3386210.1 RHS repeat-associated core domain-containing protein [Streptomyces sp. B-S-A8]